MQSFCPSTRIEEGHTASSHTQGNSLSADSLIHSATKKSNRGNGGTKNTHHTGWMESKLLKGPSRCASQSSINLGSNNASQQQVCTRNRSLRRQR
jgi:hypothetical protein